MLTTYKNKNKNNLPPYFLTAPLLLYHSFQKHIMPAFCTKSLFLDSANQNLSPPPLVIHSGNLIKLNNHMAIVTI